MARASGNMQQRERIKFKMNGLGNVASKARRISRENRQNNISLLRGGFQLKHNVI